MIVAADVGTISAVAGAIVGGIVLLGLLVAGAGFFWQSFTTGRSQADIEDEKRKDRVDRTLNELVEAQEKRYVQLERDHKENVRQLGKLQGAFEEQTKQQKWFENIFVNALDKFFRDNPGLAAELDGKIAKVPDPKLTNH